MIQRFIYNALTQSLAAIQGDPGILQDLFADIWELAPQEVTAIQTYLANHPPAVRHGYAHVDSVMPLLAIILQSEEETEMMLGDAAGQTMGLDISDRDFGCDQRGAIWTHNYQVLCYAENPDVCLYLYEIAKSALLANRDYLIDNDVQEPVQSGMDVMPDPRYLPEHLFVRALGFRCKREFTRIERGSRAGKAFKVTGMALPPGSTQSNGGVQTLIDVFDPSEG